MNARDKTPLRTLIADRLAAGEDTAALLGYTRRGTGLVKHQNRNS